MQLRRGDAAVPGRRRGARAAAPRHALLRLLGTDFTDILSFCFVDLQGHSKVRIQGCVNSTKAIGRFRQSCNLMYTSKVSVSSVPAAGSFHLLSYIDPLTVFSLKCSFAKRRRLCCLMLCSCFPLATDASSRNQVLTC